MTAADNSYLEFLEREFGREAVDTESHSGDPVSNASDPSQRQLPVDDDMRWKRAAASVEPRSRLGALFGTTSRDIDKAARLLAGTPEFGLLPRTIRRTIDLCVAIPAFFLTLPTMAVIAAFIRAETGGPVLFWQTRVGVHGEPFRLWKFRTMRNVDLTTLADGLGPSGTLFKLRNDPRITRVGRFLRRTSLDELPQLWNVLRGNMSLVGPRPPLPAEVELYDAHRGRRLLIKPGVTGLSQLNREATTSWNQLIALEVAYVENWSPWLDLRILVNTWREAFGLRHH